MAIKKAVKKSVAKVVEAEFGSGFDYSGLDKSVATDAKAAAEHIRSLISVARQSIVDIGQNLIAVKEQLGHGNFGPWLDAEFGMSSRTAQRYMNAALALADISATVSDFPAKLLYALAAPSTPAEVKDAVIAEIKDGKTLTAASVEKKIKAAQPLTPLLARNSAAEPSADAAKVNVLVDEIKEDVKSETATEAHDAEDHAEQAVLLLVENLADDIIPVFADHCAGAGWKGLTDALREFV